MNQDDYDYLLEIVKRSFMINGLSYNDNSLELDDLLQEGLLYLITNKPSLIKSLTKANINSKAVLELHTSIRYYLRDNAGLIKTQRYTEPMALVYPDEEEIWNDLKSDESLEDYYDDIALNKLLIEKCHEKLTYPDYYLVLYNFGLIGKEVSGIGIRELGDMYKMSFKTVARHINHALDMLSCDKQLRQAYEDLVGKSLWL